MHQQSLISNPSSVIPGSPGGVLFFFNGHDLFHAALMPATGKEMLFGVLIGMRLILISFVPTTKKPPVSTIIAGRDLESRGWWSSIYPDVS